MSIVNGNDETNRTGRGLKNTARIAMALGLLLGIATAFARFRPHPPVIDASVGLRLSKADISLSQHVVVFVIDSALDPLYVRKRHDTAGEPASHGSMVARVLRNHANVAIVGLPAEDATGKQHREDLLDALETCREFARRHPETRVIVNISLAFTEPDTDIEGLIKQLRGAGAKIVAAAGNDSSDEPVYPAAYEKVAAVASATESGKSPHSNYGPHINISTSGHADLYELTYMPYQQTRRIIESRGTSYAAPRVSAALAYTLQKRPDWTAAQGFNFVKNSALPIDDELYERGKLGVGYLDIAHTKALIHRPYFWIHRFLPYFSVSLLISISVAAIAIKKLPGLFMALMLWLGAVPALFVIIVSLLQTLAAIRAGWLEGQGPFMIAALGSTCACMAFLKLRPRDTLRALAPPTVLGILLGLTGTPSPAKGIVLMLLPPAATAFWEHRTRRILSEIESCAVSSSAGKLCEFLALNYEKHRDPRIRRKITETLTGLPLEYSIPALEKLIEERLHTKGARELLDFLPELPEDPDNHC